MLPKLCSFWGGGYVVTVTVQTSLGDFFPAIKYFVRLQDAPKQALWLLQISYAGLYFVSLTLMPKTILLKPRQPISLAQ